jgi:endoglucanase
MFIILTLCQGEFTATAWGDTIWGSDSDKQALEDDILQARGNFTDVPLIIGEFATSPVTTETAARWKWYDFITRTSNKYNTSVMLWDAGESFEVNSPQPWQDPTAINIIITGSKGINNTLADSAEDPKALTQFTSANLFHKSGDPIEDTNLPFIWNGNTLDCIDCSPNCGRLRANIDYSVNGNNLTFKAGFMKEIFPPYSKTGFKANLTLHFSRGADLQVQAYQWAAPILASNSSIVTSNSSQTNLAIPVTWMGKAELATVKAQIIGGSYLVDSWTQWLGPLQQGRMVCF